MSKELEALKLDLEEFKLSKTTEFILLRFDREEALNMLKALTPPTVDEVIKVLSEYYGKKVIFKENVFWYITIMYGNEQWVREVSLKDLSKDNRVDLITLIGRFYEGLEKWHPKKH